MYQGKRILGFIPARGGSKGIPHKNIIELCDRPLISYTIEAGIKSNYIDYVMVSTDDNEIANVSRNTGAQIPFMRPPELASDTSKTIDAVLYTIDKLQNERQEFDVLVLLQPTQPLRTKEDVDGAIEHFFQHKCKPLLSVSEVDDHPLLIRSIENGILRPLLNMSSTCRRQDMPKFYRVNGCIYINLVNELTEQTSFNDNEIPYIMDRTHSVDIDEISDLCMAEYYLNNSQR